MYVNFFKSQIFIIINILHYYFFIINHWFTFFWNILNAKIIIWIKCIVNASHA